MVHIGSEILVFLFIIFLFKTNYIFYLFLEFGRLMTDPYKGPRTGRAVHAGHKHQLPLNPYSYHGGKLGEHVYCDVNMSCYRSEK